MIPNAIVQGTIGTAFGAVIGSGIWLCTGTPEQFPSVLLLFAFLGFFFGLIISTTDTSDTEDESL